MTSEVRLDPEWLAFLGPEFQKPYIRDLKSFLLTERQSGQILYPPADRIFYALDSTPFSKVKVVILGQDPYHGPGQANGLCFSVNSGIQLPPSLKNIYKEISDDLGVVMPADGDLTGWSRQGVLLLNAVLTVRAGQAASHQNKGWELFTDQVIRTLNENRSHLVFMLWGAFARSKKTLIDTGKHLVLEAPHPSPLSVHQGFSGCRHFSKANHYLVENGMEAIRWDAI